MNRILMQASVKLVVPALISALTVGPLGCSAGASDPAGGAPTTQTSGAHENASPAGYDGETTFRGVYLGTGAVAAKLPELRDPAFAAEGQNLTKEQLAKYLEGVAERMRVETNAQSTMELDQLAGKLRTGEVTPEQLLEARRDFGATFGDRIVERIRAVDATFFLRFGADLQSGDHLRIQRGLEEGAKLFTDASAVEGAMAGHVTQDRKCVLILVVLVAVFFWTPQIGTPDQKSDLHQAELVDMIARRLAL